MHMDIEPSIGDCAIETSGDHPLSMDFGECVPEVDVVVQDTNEEDNKVLPRGIGKVLRRKTTTNCTDICILNTSATAHTNGKYRDWRAN
jgi:hypothetical protein